VHAVVVTSSTPAPGTPEYLAAVDGLPAELATLAEDSDTRRLSRNERRRLDRGIAAARKRIDEARAERDGKA
jgi:hypothetical protein